MENIREMTVNQLPAPTWNWLHMNESKLKLDTKTADLAIKKQVPFVGIQCYEDCNHVLQECPTGMGEEIQSLMEQTHTKVLRLEAEEGVDVQEPILLQFDYGKETAYHDIEIVAKANSSLTVIMTYTGTKNEAEQGKSYSGVRTKLKAEEKARINLIQVQLLDSSHIHFNDIGGICQEEGQIDLLQLELGSKELYSGCRIELIGKESEFHSHVGYLGSQEQRFDMNYIVNHYGKKTKSGLKVDGVLDDRASKIFRGTIDFKQGASGSEGEEQEDVLLLGDDIVNQTIPLILCAEEDVQGNHGATIGQIDDEILFYLCSRGMTKEEAQSMIVQARIDTLCSKIPNEQVVTMIDTFRQEA